MLVSVGTLAMDVAENFLGRVPGVRRSPTGSGGLRRAPGGRAEPATGRPVEERVPMLELMPRLDAVVTHGGLNTVCEALAHGVPLVVAPIKGDQPINAAQVVAAGAGVRVRFHRSGPDELRAAVTPVLDDPAYRDAARRIADSFSAAGAQPPGRRLLETARGNVAGTAA